MNLNCLFVLEKHIKIAHSKLQMEIIKSFVLDQTEYNVNVLWKDGKPLFHAKDIGNVLGLKKIRSSIADFDDDEREAHTMATPGGMQETTFLTEAGVYRLLMLSRKPIARPFQKWVTQVIISIREQGKYELIQELEKANHEKEHAIKEALQKQAEHYKERDDSILHNSLVKAYHNKHVVYFGKIKKVGEDMIIKIGSTDNIIQRSKQLAEDFGSFSLFKVFEVGWANRMLEQYMHQYKSISHLKYKEEIHNSKRSNETYKVNNDELQTILNLALANVDRFRNHSTAEKTIEIERIKLERDICKLELAKVKQETTNNPTIQDEVTYVEEKKTSEISPIILFADTRKFTHSKGEKVQRYSADGKSLIQTYASIVVALRDTSINASSRLMIKNAIKNNTLYQGYRWAFLKRDQPDDTIQDIGETSEHTTDMRKGFVAMLNLDKNKIIEVFCDQKAAGEARKFKSGANISKAIHCGSQSSGHYWMMWHDCSENLQQDYLSRATLPEKRTLVNAQQIERLHPITQEVIKRYASFADVIKDFPFSRDNLRQACTLGYIAKGYKWRFVE